MKSIDDIINHYKKEDEPVRKVKAKITRVVTEIVICTLDSSGNVEEINDICEEMDYEVTDIHTIIDVIY
jgi:hypothetical protein